MKIISLSKTFFHVKKINIKIFLFFILLITTATPVSVSSSLKLAPQNQNKKYKFLFYLSLPTTKLIPEHPLNQPNYKNILLSPNQIVFFSSNSPYSSVPDTTYDTSNYIFTIKYDTLELPCLNRSFMCTHNQFVKEYRPLYPELNFEIPKKIQDLFNNNVKASNNCLVVLLNGILSNNIFENAAWICHDNIKEVYNIQSELSEIVREYTSYSYEFPCDYIFMGSVVKRGHLSLKQNEMVFKERISDKEVFRLAYTEIKPYAVALYLKENIVWKSDEVNKPEDARCIKIQRSDSMFEKYPDYFCVYFDRTDYEMKYDISIIQARFLAEMYANRINMKLQNMALRNSLYTLTKNQKSSNGNEIEVNNSILDPIKAQIRIDYFISRHQLLNMLKSGEISTQMFESSIEGVKEKITNSVCSNIQICIKLVNKAKEDGLLPLNGYKEKFATDIQNPYNSLMPKTSYKITLPKGGNIGEKLFQEVIEMINGNDDSSNTQYEREFINELPNANTIKMAFNTLRSVRGNKKMNKIEEIGLNCRLNYRDNAYDLRRKIGLLQYVGDHDEFFEYFRTIRDLQNNRNVYKSYN